MACFYIHAKTVILKNFYKFFIKSDKRVMTQNSSETDK